MAPEFVPMGTVHAVQTQGIRESKRTGQAILESAEVQVSGLKGSTRARVIFDSGSTLWFIRSDLVKRVGAKCMGQYQTQLSRLGDSRREDKTYPLVQEEIHLRDGSKLLISLRQVPSVSASMRLVPLSLESFRPMFDISEFAGLVDKPLRTEVDILLGLDYYYDIVGPEVWRSNGVVIKQTAVGKIVTGFHQESMTENHRLTDFQMLAVASPKISQDLYNLERFWDIEEVGVIDRTDRSDDETAVELFNESIRFVKGRYEIFLDQLAKGVIEEAPVKPEGPVHYLPQHAVVIPTRETTKVRLVFDASSKPNSQFQSLNESMYRGSVFLNDLCGMLLRFRCPAYAVTSDVEKAFLQISLNHSHRDCTRFLWLRDPTESTNAGNLIVYRYARVLFGATASPFLLAATIIHHMKIANTKISNRIIDSTYMDNIISGHNTTAGLFQYYQEARQLVQSMCMNLHQWYSNNPEFMSQIHPEERGTREVPSVLGLKWNISSDTVACTVSKSSVGNVTKRNVLKCIASVYDPCGWYSAATISGKILMQKVGEAKIGWDQELLEPLRKEWHNVSNSLSGLSSHLISRRYSWPAEVQEESRFHLHCFCDASTKAYCAAVYLRAECSVGVFCDLVFAKSRVAPLKKLTIPKLELEAVKMGKRLLGFVERYLLFSIVSKTLWTDLFCTLCWIESDKVVTVFVRNRVQEIRSDQDLQFRFVPSESNPADVGSRGIKMDALVCLPIWWDGPMWLKEAELQWPKRPDRESPWTQETGAVVQLVMVNSEPQKDTLFDVTRYSSLTKLLRVTVYVKRACLLFQKQPSNIGKITSTEIKDSLTFWEHRVQNQHFGPIFCGSQQAPWKTFSRQLGLFVDGKGYIRCRGRFQQSSAIVHETKFPILIPKKSPITRLIIQDCHSKVLHYGVKHTLAKVRERYWVCQGRSIVKTTLLKCQICRIHTGGPFAIPNPPPMPDFRCSMFRPFENVGLDYLGPLFVRCGEETKKVWVALFTCSVVRAVHLEVANSLSAADFLLCFRRFAAIYGYPELVISDNARQFKAADHLLKTEFKKLSENADVVNFLSVSGVTWRYIVERAPWMGGFYERLVGTVKEAIKKSIGKWTLTKEELHTLCYEVSFVVNSRPLLYADDDPADQIMRSIVEVVPGHPLSATHTYFQRLALNNTRITSLRQGFHYIKLLHHGKQEEAHKLLTDPALMWGPERITQFSEKAIQTENVNFICHSGEIILAIMVHQIQNPTNPFRQALQAEMDNANNPRDIEFRIYSPHREMIFSSGCKYGEWKREIPGFDVYAEILKELVKMIMGDTPMENPMFDDIMNNFSFFRPEIFRSILFISDSQMRKMDRIHCGGDIIPIGGGKYREMINVLKNPKFPLSEYKWIAVYCGINCKITPNYAFSQRDEDWHVLKEILVEEASKRDKPSVLFCCSFDHPTANRENLSHVAFIKRQLHGTGVICVDWKELGDPFLQRRGSLNYRLFEGQGKTKRARTEIHINPLGMRVLWRIGICTYFEKLKFIGYTESKLANSVPKTVFAPPISMDYHPHFVSIEDHPGTSGLQVSIPTKNPTSQSITNLKVTVPSEITVVSQKHSLTKKKDDRREHLDQHPPPSQAEPSVSLSRGVGSKVTPHFPPPPRRAEPRVSSPRRVGPRASLHHSSPRSRRAEPYVSMPRRVGPSASQYHHSHSNRETSPSDFNEHMNDPSENAITLIIVNPHCLSPEC